MSQLERLFRIEQMLQGTGSVTFDSMIEALEVSPATLKRDIAYMRDRMNVPVVYDRFERRYRLETSTQDTRQPFPGLWFSSAEAKALLMMHKLLSELDTGGLLGPHIEPLLQRVRSTMTTEICDREQILKQVRMLLTGHHRPVDASLFQVISASLFSGKRLLFNYFSRHANAEAEREVSPQRLLYYRDNWYLVAYCHLRKDLRVFALDVIRQPRMLETVAKRVSESKLSGLIDAGFGIYHGGPVQWAVLHFTEESARWVKDEKWHPKQRTSVLPGGALQLEIPYLSSTELVMEILRFGPNLKVVSPPDLVAAVESQLRLALKQYQS